MNGQFGSLFNRKKSPRADNDMLSPGGASYSASPSSHGSTWANVFSSSSSAYTSSSRSSKQQAPCDPPPYSEISRHAPVTPASIVTPTPSTQNTSPDDSMYEFLKDFDTIFLVDDSASMYGRRWKDAEAAISAITPICTKHDPDGIDIYFLNHRNRRHPSRAYLNVKSVSEVREIFSVAEPTGGTRVARRLDDILSPYLARVEKMATAETDKWGKLKDPSLAVRPINIISITDGEFSDDVESVVVDAATRLDEVKAKSYQVGIQFVQIGDDPRARRDLQELDDGLAQARSDRKMRDIVDTVPWKGSSNGAFTKDYLLKVVLGSVNKRLDRREE